MNHKELDEIFQNIESTGLLEGISGENKKLAMALCLNAQAEFNKTNQQEAQFMRVSIPLARRAFAESKAFNRNQFVNYGEARRPEYMFFNARFKKHSDDLQEEADNVADVAGKIRKEIDENFKDRMGAEIIFHGFGRLVDGTIFMAYN